MMVLITFFLTYIVFNQLLYNRIDVQAVIYDFFRISVVVFILNSKLLDYIAAIITSIIYFLMNIGTIKMNLCGGEVDNVTLFTNIECFIMKLFFNSDDVLDLVTKLVMVIVGVVLSICFPIYGIFYALMQAANIILIVTIILYVFSFIVNVAVNLLLQSIIVMLLIYISPLVLTLWALERYIGASFLRNYYNVLINHLMTIPVVVLLSNIFIFLLYYICDSLSFFDTILEAFTGEEHEYSIFFGMIGFIVLSLETMPDMLSLIAVFLAVYFGVDLFKQITNYFLSRVLRTSFMSLPDLLNSDLLNDIVSNKKDDEVVIHGGKEIPFKDRVSQQGGKGGDKNFNDAVSRGNKANDKK